MRRDQPAPAPMLPDALLDRVAIRHWRKGRRQELSGRAFWNLVTRHVEWIEGERRVGDFALVVAPSSPAMMALFLAMIATGRLVAFFPPNSPIQDQAHYFEQQRHALAAIGAASICVPDHAAAETVRRIDATLAARVLEVPAFEAEDSGAGTPRGLAMFRARMAGTGELFVQHSSGTTGIKKAVAIGAPALTAQYRNYWPQARRMAGAEGPLRVASWLPLYHDMGLVAAFLLPVLGGDSISIIDPFEWVAAPARLLEMIEADGCDICWMPNFAFRLFVRLRPALPARRLESMRAWINCSEPCRLVDAAAFEHAFAAWGVRPGSVLGCYAMAETVFAVSQCPPAERRALSVPRGLPPGADALAAGAAVLAAPPEEPAPADRALVQSSGRPIPGTELRILHAGLPLPEGHYGEIALRGDTLFPAYRGQGAAASGIREDGFYLTGDLGTVLDGHLYVFGRVKEMIIVNGKNLFAGDLEAFLAGISGVKRGRVAVFGIESDATGSEELVVVAEEDAEAGATAAEARSAIIRALTESFLVKPRDVRVVAERWLVKSTSGKMSRDANRRKYLETFRAG